ncbi:iron uptake porin [Leptolyngbya sp. DQ-M1]|uniref:iron uptake porin n=1 Tax=Leptolyngbya sp. DQ-M1 TaxID=2933920 RepID=UPI003298B788
MTETGAIAYPPQPSRLVVGRKTLQNSIHLNSKPTNAKVGTPETVRSPEFSEIKTNTPVALRPIAPDVDRPSSAVPEFSSIRAIASETEPVVDGMDQVTSVSQLSDVQPRDWAFQALQGLIERYGCIAGYPDRTFRGDRAITRYEFAAGLNACLDRVQALLRAQQSNIVTQPDLDTLQTLQAKFTSELAALNGRVDHLEARSTTLEKQQFSTTTRLFGQAIVSAQASNQANVDLFPRDGVPERQGELKPTFTSNVQLSLATSFSGRDLLLTTLQTGNLRSSAPNLFTNMGRLSYESEQDNQIFISDLSYRFPIADNFGVLIGAVGVNPANTFRGINPLEGAGDGAPSLLGQRNPILAIGNGTGGVGFDWQINPHLSLQGVYSAELPSFAGNADAGGLIGGRYAAGAQLTIAPTDALNIGIHYLFSRSPDGFIGTGIGDSQLLSPFAPTNTAFTTHAIGATVAWRLNQKWTIGGWGGWTSSKAVELPGSVQTTNWMVFSAFPDLFVPGNLGGLLFGQPPKITSSTLPEGYNFPRFSNTGGRGGQPDTALHLEAFYRARLNSLIDITPGVLVIFNANHNAANDPIVIGTVRTTFRF